MSPPSPHPSSRGRQLLVEWANGQDHWIRVLVGAVLTSRNEVADAQIEDLLALLLREKELAPGETVVVEPLEYLDGAAPEEEHLVLTRIGELQNVNALAAGQEIHFNEGVTVLFGENGAGKTGYVRVLKTLAAVRNAEPILPDVRSAKSGAPSAKITYRLGSNETTISWLGEQGVRPLTRVDVFDSRGLLLHVDEDLTYVYTPSDVALFRVVNQAIERVRQRLEAIRDERRPRENPFLIRFSREAPIYPKIESLGSATNLDDLRALAAIDVEEEEQLPALRETVEALNGKSTAERLQIARAELDLYRRLRVGLDVVERFPCAVYNEAIARRDLAQVRHHEFSVESLRGESIPGVLDTPWRGFIDAAEAYIRSVEHTNYPSDEAACVYCRQSLSPAARDLILRYRALFSDAHHERASIEEGAARQASRETVAFDTAHLAGDLNRRRDQLAADEVPQVLDLGLSFLEDLSSLQGSLRTLDLIPDSRFPLLSATALSEPLDDRLQHAQELESALSGELANREARLQQELPKLRMLEARIVLRPLLLQIERHVEAARWVDRVSHVLKRFQATLKTLTESSKLASEELLNHDFESRFRVECDHLKAPEVTLEFPGRRGEPARRKSVVPRHRLSEILSEGEQKVIALADFLAEASLRRSASPIVFDDPITSLDYKRMSYVVERLAELSTTRQIVVFTHNIWFTMELLARFENEKTRCSYYDVSEESGSRGVVARASSPRLDSWGDKKRRINGLLQRAKQESEREIRDVFIEKAYEDLRGACEVVVEQDVLQKVVQSYAPNVMVAKLRDIRVEALPGAIEKITVIHDRCCRFIGSHKQPLETLNVRPTLQQLEEDWLTVQEIHKTCGR